MDGIINLNKTKGNFNMEPKDFAKAEVVILTRTCRVIVEGKKEAKMYSVGDKVKVSGNDKVQLLNSGAGIRETDKEAKLKLEAMTVGDQLSIILDEGAPIQNVPASFREEGQEVVEMNQIDEKHWRVLVKKKN